MKLDRSGLVGRHDQATDVVIPIANAIVRTGGRYSLGFITAGGQIRYAGNRVKAVQDEATILLTVVSKLGKQEVRVYDLRMKVVREAISALKGYSLNDN
jgi:hypothetical protein